MEMEKISIRMKRNETHYEVSLIQLCHSVVKTQSGGSQRGKMTIFKIISIYAVGHKLISSA